MIRKIFWLLLLSGLSINLFGQTEKDLPPIPRPARLINDFAGVLSNDEKQELENKLKAYYDTTSTQLTVILLRSVGQFDIAEYTIQTGKYWKIGQGGKNNGLLLLLAIDDRKYFTATGYGMEGALPDATVKIIEQRFLVPNLKTKNYYQAIDQTTNAFIKAAAGEFKGGPGPQDEVAHSPRSGLYFILGIFILLFILRLFRRRGSRGGGFMGGIPFIFFNGGGSSGGSNFGGGGGGFNFGGGDFGGGGAGGSW